MLVRCLQVPRDEVAGRRSVGLQQQCGARPVQGEKPVARVDIPGAPVALVRYTMAMGVTPPPPRCPGSVRRAELLRAQQWRVLLPQGR